MRIIIHAGFHKTATTWFQRRFYPYVLNFRYLSNRAPLRDIILNPDSFAFQPDLARHELMKEASENLVMCEENILGGLREGSLYSLEMGQRLHAVFPEAEIVLFIRSQPERFASTYLFYLFRNGGTYSPKKFIERTFGLPGQRGDINFYHLEYHRIIERYRKLFGKNRVHIFCYEEFARNNAAFIERYCAKLGFEIEIGTVNFERENQGIRRGLIPLARLLGGFYYRPIIHKSVFVRLPFAEGFAKNTLSLLNGYSLFGAKPGARELFGDDIYLRLCSRYRESNQILIEKHGLTKIMEFDYPL